MYPHVSKLRPRKLTWNLKMDPSNRRFLLETHHFRFYVKFRGSTTPYASASPHVSHLHATLQATMRGPPDRETVPPGQGWCAEVEFK